MANRYDWKLCPITTLAIWLSCNTITGNALFPGSSQNKRYGDNLKIFLERDDIKSQLQEFASLLLGSHSSRKGATNHAAQSGLCADVLMAVLLRGQWDIGDTLTRYFKLNQAADCLIARLLAGHDIHDLSFGSLPPHFPNVSDRQVDVVTKNQFPDSPLNGPSQNTILKMCIASLVHHHDDIVRSIVTSYALASSFPSIFLIKQVIKIVITDLNSPVHFNLIQYLTLPFLNCFEIEFLFLFTFTKGT